MCATVYFTGAFFPSQTNIHSFIESLFPASDHGRWELAAKRTTQTRGERQAQTSEEAHHGRCSLWGEQRSRQFDKQQVKLGQGLHEERILTHRFRWKGEGAQLKGRAVGDEKASHAQEKAGRVSLFTR